MGCGAMRGAEAERKCPGLKDRLLPELSGHLAGVDLIVNGKAHAIGRPLSTKGIIVHSVKTTEVLRYVEVVTQTKVIATLICLSILCI